MLLEDLAKELVEGTSDLLGGRTLNVMNCDGIIIASTEHERIGSFHKGAWEAARTGKTVNIRVEQVSSYPGAKEGCNMPLRINGSIIGVIGVYGNPDEITDIAHLLEVYATKCYQLEAIMRPRLSESALRSQLMMYLLSSYDVNSDAADRLMGTLKLNLRFPVYTAVISSSQGLRLPEQGVLLAQELEKLKFLNKQTDIWGIVDERMVALCSGVPQRDRQILSSLPAASGIYRISFGEPSNTLRDIQYAYKQALTLDRYCTEPVCDINELPFKCRFMLGRTAETETGFLEALYRELLNEMEKEECAILLRSAACYYRCGRSVSAAAKEEFVHKNTMQYRVKRLLKALNIEGLPGFWQEYLVRLLLDYLHCKPGPKRP